MEDLHGVLRQDRLYSKFSECMFWLGEVQFLGNLINKNEILVDMAKIEIIMQSEVPKSPSEIESFLGLAGYYRRFFHDFSRTVTPLTRLTKKSMDYHWWPR